MKTKILLVDDERDIIEFLKYNLEQEGFEVITAFDGMEALEKLPLKPDLIVLDVMMPVLDGFETCQRIRQMKEFANTPIVFLTAKGSENSEIEGLSIGADDYIRKPISPRKLIARVRSNLRRIESLDGKGNYSKVSIGPLSINRELYLVQLDGEEKIFPRKEFEILFYLANNPGKVVTRETMLKDIWGTNVFVVDRTVDVHIRKIREKLDKHSNLIETIKGVGYRFKNME